MSQNKFMKWDGNNMVGMFEVGTAPHQFSVEELTEILALYAPKPPVVEVVVEEAKGLFRRRK